ncbi:hypothetical protein [Piscibacillus salipiscarius]|uniref:hypothetical protein n=1 Tax=Piscibacillus salipiscarius TaxID=299480 RepID=UPI0024368686|nr:hypothetical protein [Piscibacillus salipiscarius]
MFNEQRKLTGKKWILFLAVPAVIENFFQTVIGFVDTFLLQKLELLRFLLSVLAMLFYKFILPFLWQ